MCHGMGCPYEIGPYGDCGKRKGESCPCPSWEEEQNNSEDMDNDEEDD